MLTPFGGLAGGVPAITAAAGSAAVTMGAIGLGLLVLTALVILLADGRCRS